MMGSVVRLDANLDVPLIVDLDGTLILTDSLQECLVQALLAAPLQAVASLRLLASGRAAFKREVTGLSSFDAAHAPLRVPLLETVRDERTRGRPVHLVTAADQSVADAMARELGVFDSAIGSDGKHNLKAEAKLAHLKERFPEGFIYAGDHAADLPVFRAARGAVLCDVTPQTEAAVRAAGVPILASFRRPRASPWTMVRALRPHQWTKNTLLFVPMFVGHAFGDPSKVMLLAAGFAILCVLTSATYVINDLADLSADRRHPTKRLRPFASGELAPMSGLLAAPVMIVASLVAAFALAPPFAFVAVAYLAMTLSYSCGVKRVALLDVFFIGVMFTLRIVMGTLLLRLGPSPWLLSFSLAFFLSLAIAKRHGELMRALDAEREEIAGRGYRTEDWPLTLTFGVGAGLVSIVIMLLYMTNDAAPSGFYRNSGWLFAIPAMVALWLMRIWLLAHRKVLHEDPVVFALKDPASLLLGGLVAVAFFLAT
jgi:4-hydroxybenzoate polyprenyltransferase/phosphoserine phosphatase